jgi:hypothetical protein
MVNLKGNSCMALINDNYSVLVGGRWKKLQINLTLLFSSKMVCVCFWLSHSQIKWMISI